MRITPAIGVIVPTKGIRERRPMIRRALRSILDQADVRGVPLVVVNGPDRDPRLVQEIEGDAALRVQVLETADLPGALAAGRQMVDTEWFAELDDDDILLPGALAYRLKALQEDPTLDVVVTNGIRRSTDGDTLHLEDVAAVRRDPLRALLRGNWLLAGSWLCRTRSVGSWLFEGMPAYRECTYLALQFATRCRLKLLDRPTVAWYTNTPGSASSARAFALASVAAQRRYLELDLPEDVHDALRRQLAGLCHHVSDLHLQERDLRQAWTWHLRSLREPRGWRHLLFTRHLLRALWHA